MSEKNISVVVPLFNEEESLPELTEWIARVMNENNFSYEIILVDDGSKDKSWSVIEQLAEKNKNIRGIKFRRNNGKSAALQKGFELASGKASIGELAVARVAIFHQNIVPTALNRLQSN